MTEKRIKLQLACAVCYDGRPCDGCELSKLRQIYNCRCYEAPLKATIEACRIEMKKHPQEILKKIENHKEYAKPFAQFVFSADVEYG